MKIFVDTANLAEIREVHSWGILAGVTTNPSLIAREGRDFIETIHEICELVQGPVSAEVVAQDAEGMVREGRLLAQVHEHVVVKVPMSPAGVSACRRLADDGIRVNVTLCFQPVQALYAALAGATYISPFVGRVDDISWDGNDLIQQIVAIYAQDPDIETQVLAASIRHPQHLVQAALAGAHVATVPFKVLQQCYGHPLTTSGNEAFLKDWAKVPDPDVAAAVERWLAKKNR
jgi:transaldolase